MWPVLLETTLGGWLDQPWLLDSYSSLIIFGYGAGMALAMRQMRREQEKPWHIIDLGFWALVSGLIGSRLVFIATNLEQYFGPTAELAPWQGGLVWYGGFVTASLTIIAYCRIVGIDAGKVIDICVTYMSFSTSIGRLGCFAAGCCYGRPTSGGWGASFPPGSPAQIDHASRGLVVEGAASLPVHPTQLYESGAELALFFLLVALSPRKRFHGQLFLTWLIGYSLARFVIEAFRGDAIRGIWWGLSTSQWTAMAVLVCAAAWLGLRARRVRSAGAAS